MKKCNDIFLKVDDVEPVYKCCSAYDRLHVDGAKVWIGSDGHEFSCDQYTVCNPDAVRKDGRHQAMHLAIELADMNYVVKQDLFGASTVKDIFLKFPYEDIVEKLDAWKKEKETIRVRDEVYSNVYETRFVVTKVFVPSGGEDAIVNGIKKDGTTVKGLLLHNVKKTGLHVDDLDSYLEV